MFSLRIISSTRLKDKQTKKNGDWPFNWKTSIKNTQQAGSCMEMSDSPLQTHTWQASSWFTEDVEGSSKRGPSWLLEWHFSSLGVCHHHHHHHPPQLGGKLSSSVEQRQPQLQRFIVCVFDWRALRRRRARAAEHAVVIPIATSDEDRRRAHVQLCRCAVLPVHWPLRTSWRRADVSRVGAASRGFSTNGSAKVACLLEVIQTDIIMSSCPERAGNLKKPDVYALIWFFF